MKKIILTIIVSLILLLTNHSYAQEMWAAVISTSGIILGDYKIANSSVNPIPVSITQEEAKNIFALNILQSGKGSKITLVKVKSYQMTVMNKAGASTSFTNDTELLSEEMKIQLESLESGSKLYFEGIVAIWPDDTTRSIVVMSFIVI